MFKLYDDVLFKYSLPNHLEIKDHILNNLIDGNTVIDPNTKDEISRSDYDIKYEKFALYFEKKKKSLIKYFHPIIHKQFNCKEFCLDRFWYQQYTNNNKHSWHYHGECNMIAVYFLELPDDNFKTQFKDMFRNKVIEYEAKEGDIVLTNSLVMHQSPTLLSNKRKTSISLNYNIRAVNE